MVQETADKINKLERKSRHSPVHALEFECNT